MELCTYRPTSLPPQHKLSTLNLHPLQTSLHFYKPHFSGRIHGLVSYGGLKLRATTSEEASISINGIVEETDESGDEEVNNAEIAGLVEEEVKGSLVEEVAKEGSVEEEVKERLVEEETKASTVEEVAKEMSSVEEPKIVEGEMPGLEFLNNLDLKLNPEDTSTYLIYGGGALFVLWLASAVVGAIDSVPLVPKVLELAGLGYAVWFSSRYLVLKKNRDELVSKFAELKKQTLGPNDS